MPETKQNIVSDNLLTPPDKKQVEITRYPLLPPALLIIFGFILRIISLYHQESIGVDSVRYLTFARNYMNEIYHTIGPTGLKELPDLGYPLLITILSRLTQLDVESSARWVSLIAGTVTLVLIYMIALRAAGYKTAMYSLLLASTCLPLIQFSSYVQTESLFIMVFAFCVYISYATTQRGYNTFWFTLGGVFCAYAYLTRGLGISFLLFFPLAVLLIARFENAFSQAKVRAKYILGIVMFLFGFIIIATPYVIMLNHTYDRFVLSDQSIWHTPRAKNPHVSFSKDSRLDGTLTPDKSDYLINTDEFFQFEPVNPFVWTKHFVVSYLKNQVGIYYYHLRELYSPLILILLGLGLFGTRWENRFSKIMILMAVWSIPFLILQPIYYTEARYIAPITIFIVAIAGRGTVIASDWFIKQLSGFNPRKVGFVFNILLFLLLTPMMIYPVTHKGPQYQYPDLRDAGRFLEAHIAENGGNGTLAVTPVTGYYAKTEPDLVLPDSKPDVVTDFARSQEIDFIVLSERRVHPNRPMLREALHSSIYPSDWKLIFDNEDYSGYRVRIFRILNQDKFQESSHIANLPLEEVNH